MKDIKTQIAVNIAELRKANGLTQFELAEKLNYSDKSVSKWERAESLPDIVTFVEMANLFGVSVDALIYGDAQDRGEFDFGSRDKERQKKRIVITTLSLLLVCFVAVSCFVALSIFLPEMTGAWLSFLSAVPVSCIVLLVFNTVWFDPRYNYFIISILCWSLLATAHLFGILYGQNLWMLYLLGIPAQIGIFVWSRMHSRKKETS